MMDKLMNPPASPAGAPPVAQAPAKKTAGLADLRQVFHVVVRRIWIVALCFVISLSLTVVKLVKQVPVYQSTVTLFMSRGLPLPENLKQQEVSIIGEYLETQISIVRSGLIISRARDRMNRPSEEISRKLVSVSANPAWRAAFMYIRAESTDPVFAADFANAMAEEYLNFKAEEQINTSQSTVISLTQQANRVREELQRAEERLVEFEKDNNMIAMQQRGNVAANALASLSGIGAEARTERLLLEAQRPLLNQASDAVVLETLAPSISYLGSMAQPPIAAMVSGGTGVTVQATVARAGPNENLPEAQGWAQTRREKALAEAQLADLRTRFRDSHPEIRAVLNRIAQLDRELEVELQIAMQQYSGKLESLSLKERATQIAMKEWEDEALDTSRKARDYQTLQKDVDRLQSLYDMLFERLKQMDISLGVQPETFRIMERAVPAGGPVTPRRLQSIFMSALIGIGVGLGIILLLEFMDDSIRYPEEVSQHLAVPFFGVIPAANWDPDDLRTHVVSNIDQKSGLVESYRNARSAILVALNSATVRTLAFTSALPREGKTTTCLNMAISMAQAGQRVLVVDADLRRGEVHKFFGLEGGRGLSDILSGQAKPESVIQRTGLPNLDMVATGPFPANPAELILRGEFRGFVDVALRNYDRIFFDCPPVMAVSEGAVLASMADAAIMVVWAGQTSRKICRVAMQLLRERGANVIGCLLNNLEFARVGYYYYSTYYGYYDYDYRYDRTSGRRR